MEPLTQANHFDADAIENLNSDELLKAKAVEAKRELVEQSQERTPTTKNKTKTAQQAEQALEIMTAVEPLFEGANDWLGDRYPGVQYTPEQLDFATTLFGKIASKYVDVGAEKYGEEIMLGSFLLFTGGQKAWQIYKIERESRRSTRGADDQAEAEAEE